MRKIFLLLLIITSSAFSQDRYTTISGIEYKVGDTLKIGQPLSHLGWRSIYIERGEDYITNKNLITKEVVIMAIDTTNKPVNFSLNYKNKIFKVDIDEALRNKEIIPNLELKKSGEKSIYDKIAQLKELYDNGALNEEEFNTEKKKLLGY